MAKTGARAPNPRRDGGPLSDPDAPDASKVLAGRLATLARMAREGRLPSREDFVASALDVASMCAEGIQRNYPGGKSAIEIQPQHCVRALEVAAHIALEANIVQGAHDPLADPAAQGAKERLAALGYAIVNLNDAPKA